VQTIRGEGDGQGKPLANCREERGRRKEIGNKQHVGIKEKMRFE